MNAAIVFDLVMLALLLVVAFAYARRGFAAGLVQFVGNLASLIGALVLSHQASPLLFEKFFQNGFVTSIQNTLTAEGTVNIQSTIEKYAGFLPESIKESLTASAAGLLDSGAPDMAVKLVDEVIAPLLTPIIAIVLFFVAFALCRLLVGLLVAVLTNVNRIPVMGSVNRFFGFLMGLLAGVVDLYLVLCAVWAVIVITGGSIGFLNDQALAGSITYSLFGRFNPFY
ncbi:MAG: CvpA family protein [Oscillospiraceae bacterium]|nr:CvpA family protein [Oscillospiraceae bacterium]